MKSLGNASNKMMKLDFEKQENDDVLNRLHSDLSSLFHQIDELVVKAFKVKSVSKEGTKKIESFSNVLSDMLSCLKPWVPRLQIALSSPSVEPEPESESESKSEQVPCDESNVCDSPQETTLDSLVSPSPLVSWRANCTVERGRQMFMLTPLPLSKALSSKAQQQPAPKSEFSEFASSTNTIGTSTFLALSKDVAAFLDNVSVKQTPMKPASSLANEEANNQEPGSISSPLCPKRDTSMLVMMTPCLKFSPLKSCVLLEPISEICHHGNEKVRKCTPFPVGVHYSDSEASESPGSDASQGLALKYPELLGIQQVSKSEVGKKNVDASPDWLTSPPKTCVLLEPPDENSLELEKADNESCIQITDSILKQQASKLKDDVSKDHNQAQKSCKQDHFVGNLSRIESTPMWLESESSFRTGKRPGENTLKKELWTKFEAASTCGFQPKLPTVQENTQKGFLDLLEEASYDE